MSKGTVCITGGTGFVGFAVLLEALRNGYAVHIVVRSETKANWLKAHPALPGLDSSASFFTVPDLTAPGSLDAAIAGVDYVIHVASPVPQFDAAPEERYNRYIHPAVNCTLSALESAKKAGTVKRVVVTSSLAAFMSPKLPASPDSASTVVVTEADMNDEIPPPWSDDMVAYCASKTAALRRSLAWMSENSPSFDLVNIAPSFVEGRSYIAQSSADLASLTVATGYFLRMVTGAAKTDTAEIAHACHIDDIAELHVRALDREKIPGNESYLASTHFSWNDIRSIVAEKFPEFVKSGVLPNDGNLPTRNIAFSSEKAQRTFGIKFKSLEKMVVDTVSQYLEFLEKEKREK
ncbi:uncharacterized protein K452DRAFT_283670 [Aplosporella prunicola CBS 121167]|uniref:NAD-dependent epimerase/dehydratase domain-containing protein n=1 Tax=Aplosporella prunicola CBS 121167 TaxID=1176127 RepID=A0A6A6BUC4_9PEZI|nr:uncharacterized protein K452DRAFT_283670 [Aplosporella prunicola CBS 121167]KAF2146407.1 hypothetical protein K452DRAFT_283670 [Aplosporella prunicola CBS 121167]